MCTLASLLSQLVFLRYFGSRSWNWTNLVWPYESHKCTSSNFPAIYLVQEAGLAPARFSCLSINLRRGHVCLSFSPHGLNSSTTLVFLISNMSKNFRSSDVLNLSLLYRNIRSCFRFSLQFLWTRAVLPGGLAQAFDWIVHRLRSVLLNWQTSQFPYFSSSVYWELIFCTLLG